MQVSTAEAAIYFVMNKHNIGYQVADDMIAVLKEVLLDSKIMKNIKLSRTKASKIVKNVIAIITIITKNIPFGLAYKLTCQILEEINSLPLNSNSFIWESGPR